MKQALLIVDIVRGALLRRMVREAGVVMTDSFLSAQRRAEAVILYERIGNNFVEYIKRLYTIRSPSLLFVLATNAVNVFCENLNLAWCYSYDGKCAPIQWLPTPKNEEALSGEFE